MTPPRAISRTATSCGCSTSAGACLAGVIVSEDVRPGVVRMQTGAWYDPLEPGKAGSLDRHGNPNVLTQDRGTSKLGRAHLPKACWSRSNAGMAICRKLP